MSIREPVGYMLMDPQTLPVGALEMQIPRALCPLCNSSPLCDVAFNTNMKLLAACRYSKYFTKIVVQC